MCLLFFGLLWSNGFAQIGPPPVIVVQPSDQTVPYGGTAVFVVAAVSGTQLRYQWRFNGVDIQGPDAERSTYIVADATDADAGKYSVRVRNSAGSVKSSNATLAVINTPPRFDSVQMTSDGLELQLSGPIGSSYVILASADFTNWTPICTNAALTGSVVFTDTTAANHSIRYYRAMLHSTAILERNASGGNKIEVKLGRKASQSFRHRNAGEPSYTISKIVLRLSRETTAPDGDLNFSVGTGINSDALAWSSATVAPSGIINTSAGNSFQRYEIVFGTPVGPLTAGTTYYLNLECEASNGRPIYCESTGSDTYPNGTYYKDGVDDGQDLWFQIWGQ